LEHQQRGCLGQGLVLPSKLLLQLAHFPRVVAELLLRAKGFECRGLPLRENALLQAFATQEGPELFVRQPG
jgi:hypothetical protein